MTSAEIENWKMAKALMAAIDAREGGEERCCLHVVMADRNYDDESADVCLREAFRRGHQDCILLATHVRNFSGKRRAEFYRACR